MRSNDKVTATAWEGNALRRTRGCLSASGVTRLMHSLGVIVAGVFWLSVALWALSAARLPTVTYHTYGTVPCSQLPSFIWRRWQRT